MPSKRVLGQSPRSDARRCCARDPAACHCGAARGGASGSPSPSTAAQATGGSRRQFAAAAGASRSASTHQRPRLWPYQMHNRSWSGSHAPSFQNAAARRSGIRRSCAWQPVELVKLQSCTPRRSTTQPRRGMGDIAGLNRGSKSREALKAGDSTMLRKDPNCPLLPSPLRAPPVPKRSRPRSPRFRLPCAAPCWLLLSR